MITTKQVVVLVLSSVVTGGLIVNAYHHLSLRQDIQDLTSAIDHMLTAINVLVESAIDGGIEEILD